MTVKNYQEIPSSAINNIVIDTEKNTVSIQYNNNNDKIYTYSTEDAESFDQQLLAEFDSDDISVGSFVNQNVMNGTLQLLAD
jgi:ATP-dependent Zn protease